MNQQTYQDLQEGLARFINEGYRSKDAYFIPTLAGEIHQLLTEDELREFVEALGIKNEPVEL
jgi:hypothetical protein